MIAIPKGQKKAKKRTLASLKASLDKLWSEYIRRKASRNGIAICVTCQKAARWQDLQCGHFVSRVHLATRWLETNTHVQCGTCNVLLRGNYVEFAVYMNDAWGWQTIRDLRELKHTTVKLNRSDYEERIADVQAKLAELDERQEFAEAA